MYGHSYMHGCVRMCVCVHVGGGGGGGEFMYVCVCMRECSWTVLKDGCEWVNSGYICFMCDMLCT